MRVSDLAAKVYLSTDYFRQVFKMETGLTPIEYINKARVAKAARLLSRGESVALTAQAVGVDDVSYFSRLFRGITGCTPSEYRQKK